MNTLCMDKMVRENLGLVRMVAHEMVNKCCLDYEDLFQVGSISLMKSTETYDPKYKVKFSTYATRVIRNDMINHIRKESKYFSDSSLDDANEDYNYELPDVHQNVEKSVVDKILVEEIKERLDQQEFDILYWRNVDCLTQKEVADKIGCSQGHVYRLERKIIDKIKEWYKNG